MQNQVSGTRKRMRLFRLAGCFEMNDIAVVYFSPSITRLLKVINDKEMLVQAIVLACTICTCSRDSAQTRSDAVEDAFARATQLHQSGDFKAQYGVTNHSRPAPRKELTYDRDLGAAYSRLGRHEEAIAQYQQA